MTSSRTFSRCAVAAAAMLFASSTAIAQGTAPRRTLTPMLRLDANTEDFSAFTLNRQGNAPYYVGPKNEIILPLQQDASIRMYDSTGKRIATVGRRGSGPGEFRSIFRLGWLRDTMWVYDASQRRMSYYDARGTFARDVVLSETLRQPVDGDDPHVITDFAPSAIGANGTIVGQIIMTNGREPSGGWLLFKYYVASVSADHAVKQILEIPARAVAPRAYMPVDGPTKSVWATVPFANDAIYAFSTAGDRFAIMTTNRTARTFTVSTYAANGTAQFTKTFPYTARALPGNVVDSAVTATTRNVRQPPEVVSQLQKKVREAMPPDYPPVGSIVLARDGSTWIRVSGSGAPDHAMVLDAKGNVSFTVGMTKNLDIVDADARRVWAVDVDSDGLASVVVFGMAVGNRQ